MPTLVTSPAPRGDVVDIPPALLQIGGPASLVIVLWWSLAKGWLVTAREADDLRAQRDRSDARAERLLDTNHAQAQALLEQARKDNLAVRAIESIKATADERGEQDGAK